MSEERLVEIETKLAHQEYLLNELNDVITKQQETIRHLEERYGTLKDRLRSITGSNGSWKAGSTSTAPASSTRRMAGAAIMSVPGRARWSWR